MLRNNFSLENEVIKEFMHTFIFHYKELYLSSDFFDVINGHEEDVIVGIVHLLDFANEQDQAILLSIAYNISVKIKNKIEKNIKNTSISMFSGIGYSAFSVNILSKKTGILKSFSESLNLYLINLSYEYYSKYLINCNDFRTEDFDLINGVSGVLNYILNTNLSDDNNPKIYPLVNFLINITKDDNGIPLFYTNNKNLHNDLYKEMYPNGSVNLSMSHGIVSILCSLCKYKMLDYKNSDNFVNSADLNSAILKIAEIYNIFYDKKLLRFDTQISLENYVNRVKSFDMGERESWCYGSCSISIALYKALYGIKTSEYKKYKYISRKILSKKFEDFKLDEPIICHGFLGLILMILSLNNMDSDTKNDNLILLNLKTALNLVINHLEYSLEYSKQKKINILRNTNLSVLEGINGLILVLSMFLSENNSLSKEVFSYFLLY